ncbi:MAG TPA: SpoIIE family protein phosphatase [Candidatus Baltobacteraceae bacterium]|nr:SpoIIE family protein phosphatase [Candidatus Baltobacteraceae bacterium]
MVRPLGTLFSQLRVQAILIALVPIVVLAAMLAYTVSTRAAIGRTAFWADHTQRVILANDALQNAFSQEDDVATSYRRADDARDVAAFRAAVREVRRRVATLVSEADATPGERRYAGIFATAVDTGSAFLARYFYAARRGDSATMKAMIASPATAKLSATLVTAKRDVDRAERVIAVNALASTSLYLRRFSAILLGTLLGGMVLFLALAVAFAIHVARRAERLRTNAEELLRGEHPDPLPGDDEIAGAEREYRTILTRMQQEHNNATVLQRALLPQNLPQVPGVRIDASYTPSLAGADVGGDWYDVFLLGDGRLCISVGDVSGHGLQAASTMAQMRQSVRMAARLYEQPSEVLQAVNRAACDDSGPLVTLFYGELSLTSGVLRYASAGHPMPITVRATGVVEQITGGGLIMGADRRAEYRQHSLSLDAGSAIVVFTDGVVEVDRKLGRDYSAGVERLIDIVNREYYNATENIANVILRDVLDGSVPGDDAAVLFIGITDIGFARVNTVKTWTIDARSASAARRAKRAFLWHLGEFASDGTDLSAPELIFGELVGNVARHTPGSAEITLEIMEDGAFLHVADEGQPIVHAVAQPDALAEGGRGLLLVENLARALTIARTRRGNRVTAELPIMLDRREPSPRVPRRFQRRRVAQASS